MLSIFIYTYPILLIFLGVRYPREKKVTALFIIYFAVLIGLNSFTPDYAEYKRIYYNTTDFWNIDLGFRLICSLFNTLGFSYQQFRMIWGSSYAILAFLAARRFTKKYNFILAMWLIWPFIPSVSGIRFTMASMIVCYGIPFLLEDKRGLIKYIICVFIAAFIHFSVLFYLIFIFARKKYSLRSHLIAIGSIIVVVIIIRANVISSIASKVLPGMMAYKVKRWLTVATALNGDRFLAESLVVIIFAVLINEMVKPVRRSYSRDEQYYVNRSILYKFSNAVSDTGIYNFARIAQIILWKFDGTLRYFCGI